MRKNPPLRDVTSSPFTDLNGNALPGAGASISRSFDRSTVRPGEGQVWADDRGVKYMPLFVLEATDTLPERFEVSTADANGAIGLREMVASAFAALTLEADPGATAHLSFDVRDLDPHFGAAALLIKAGANPDDLAKARVADNEIIAALARSRAGAEILAENIGTLITQAGSNGADQLAGAIAAIIGVSDRLAEDMRQIAANTKRAAIGKLGDDLTVLTIIADAGPAGIEARELVNRAAPIIGGQAKAVQFFQASATYAALGWIEPVPGTNPQSPHIRAGASLFADLLVPRTGI
jgi:hypothetical protein